MQSADPCAVCSGNALKLIDGYYYCVECGTQNTNVRETVVEQKALGDGTFALGTRKKIIKIHDSKIQMSAEWYKWHAYNFVILGLADELVAAGAKPSFKLKLLWIWTKYIKKYQNKDALGVQKKPNEEGNNENLTLPSFMFQENSNSTDFFNTHKTTGAAPDEVNDEQDTKNEQKNKKINNNEILDGSRRDIKFLSKGVIVAMLYLALNFDESDIQLYHILRFIKEKRLNFSNIQRFLPDDIDIKSIQEEWLKFIHSKVCNMHNLRALAMSLLRKLDLGTPKVPDMRKIIDDFLLELCLPNDIKPMIYSLMFFHHCDFLDINSRSKAHLVLTPDYEGVAMSYILVTLKMCFGLDSDYEEKLSDAVEKINDERNLSKSYKMGKYSEPSTRLFSFREWCSYMQFRKITLCKSCLHMAEHHYLDTDDNVYLEHMSDRPQNNKDLQDETAMNLISKIPEEDEGRVIPKSTFLPTLTPMSDYTEIIIEHNQDQEKRELLSEDFTQYSLNYACEYLELVGTNSENIIKGVSEERKTFREVILGTIVTKKSNKHMVYVKNCENRNWLITKPPKIEHVTNEDVQKVITDKESDHGYDSEHPTNEKDASKDTVDKDDTDDSIAEDSREINVSEHPVSEKDVSKETENVGDTDQSINEDIGLVYDSENPSNEKEQTSKTGNVNDTNQSTNEDIRLVYDSEDPANKKVDSSRTGNVDDVNLSINENIRLVYDSEELVNDKEEHRKTGNIDNADLCINEDIRLVYPEDSANEKEHFIKTGYLGDIDQSMNEDIRLVYDSEEPVSIDNVNSENPANISEVNYKIDNVDQSMAEEISDLEKLAKEKEGNENIVDINVQEMEEVQRRFIITEEDSDKNIFDDTFEELYINDEMEQNNGEDFYDNNENFQEPLLNNESIYDDRASISDVSDNDTVYATFNPDSFDREQTIKELILHACKKHKIPIPQEYKPPKEPRKRKADKFGNEETTRKRAKVNRFEMKQKIDELICNYHNLKQSDLINQMQEAVSLAIQRNQLIDTGLNVSNITQVETANLTTEQSSDALTRLTNTNITEIVENQSNLNPQVSILEQQQNPDKTIEDDEVLDETWESKLFEGEEEMKIDDLVPKGDPKFDEEKYDVNQLYIKIKVENEDVLENVPSNLEQILNKKIEQCKHSTEFKKFKPQPLSVKPVKTKYESDSEDELPLHVLQEEKKLIAEKISWEDNFEPLINEANVKEFKYWFRHYDEDFMNKSHDWHKKFDEELKENTPSSFYFVIRECAAILNCSTFTLYKHMQALEKYIIARAKYPD